MPVVMLQLFGMDAYEEFVRLLERASPDQAGKLPSNPGAARKDLGIKELILKIREMFERDPTLAERMRNVITSYSIHYTKLYEFAPPPGSAIQKERETLSPPSRSPVARNNFV